MRPADRAGPRRWVLVPAAVLILSGLMAAGCSSSKPAYCADAANLKTSVSNLGNVDVATNGLSSLQTALSSVQASASTLTTDAKSAFPSQTTALNTSLSALAAAITSAKGQPAATAATAVVPARRPGEDLSQRAAKRRLRQLLVTSARRGEPRDRHGHGQALPGARLTPGDAMPFAAGP